jgi:uncharacterized membrane protein
MLSILLSSLTGVLSIMLLDYIWLAKIAKSFYLDKLSTHITVSSGSLVPYLPAIPLVYIVAITAIWMFSLPSASTAQQALINGALLGFFMYAFYDLTNLATLKDYPWSLTIIDTLWGTVLMGATTLLMYYVKNLLA